jgi:CRISPR-associated protein Cas2
MFVLVTYDVNTETPTGRGRLRRVAKTCEGYGQRVQNSVFECVVGPDQWIKLRQKLLDLYDPKEDSLRFYFLGSNWKHRVEHQGIKAVLDPEGPIVL